MKFKSESDVKRSIFSRQTIVKAGISVAFLFWIYVIWNSTSGLNEQMKKASDQSLAVHNLQVEFKNEVQEWKDVLLRSNNQESLDKNWQTFEKQYHKVAADAQGILQKSDVRAINVRLQAFIDAHTANFEQYKNSKAILAKNGFDPHPADAAVKGIDRPLLGYLEEAAVAMQQEQQNIDDRLTAKARSQVEQSLIVLAFIAVLVVWMPKW